ncbi:TPM domain-containing protein [Rhodanobacter sp. MP1X3]|uniref:TPM domain-containing protein n=1 Tax=Rhodanobacter sp. MP1X3 TaxID=2723086 RepID=UPI0016154F70|nr:TPM domain-containing protein [Rhodanobacter sp. MP1X3]MBB6242339.1 putative membrane protein [Rhodanobacter sp. MP1X3]
MARLQRLLTNLFGQWFAMRRSFPESLLDEMTAAIANGERTHLGEVRFAVESRLSPWAVLEGVDAATRARQIFAQLQVWDTEHNTGVLFYVLMAEKRIEIVADRGIANRVAQSEWDAVCAAMRNSYAAGRWCEGSLAGIAAAHALLAQHFPSEGIDNPDELPDRPVLL